MDFNNSVTFFLKQVAHSWDFSEEIQFQNTADLCECRLFIMQEAIFTALIDNFYGLNISIGRLIRAFIANNI